MDISSLFKTCVRTVMLQNKDIDNSKDTNFKLKLHRKQNLLVNKVHMIANQIAKLREILINRDQSELKLKYLTHNSIGTLNPTDTDFNNIDSVAQDIISTSSKLIKELRREIVFDVSQQNQEHFETMTLLIEDYLKDVCNIYSKQKAIRVQKAMIQRKIHKLESLIKPRKNNIDSGKSKVKDMDNLEINNSVNQTNSLKIQEINNDEREAVELEDEKFSSEDIQLFQAENDQLLNEFQTITEEVTQIESKVVYISELQEIFTKKILEQDKNLERVLITVVGSTENVKEANEQIRKAIQRNAGLRVWILFFLLIMSFTLIFLDWYNP